MRTNLEDITKVINKFWRQINAEVSDVGLIRI